MHYQAVGKMGGTGSSSSSGVAGTGAGSRGGVSGIGLAGMDGLKSGSGGVCSPLSIRNLSIRERNTLIIFPWAAFVIEHAQ